MPLKKKSQDAPTRLAESTPTQDRFVTQIYYAKAISKFLIVDHHAKPYTRNWVAVECLAPGRIAIERFRGQKYLGVVRILKRFQLPRSSWWIAGLIHYLI